MIVGGSNVDALEAYYNTEGRRSCDKQLLLGMGA